MAGVNVGTGDWPAAAIWEGPDGETSRAFIPAHSEMMFLLMGGHSLRVVMLEAGATDAFGTPLAAPDLCPEILRALGVEA